MKESHSEARLFRFVKSSRCLSSDFVVAQFSGVVCESDRGGIDPLERVELDLRLAYPLVGLDR